MSDLSLLLRGYAEAVDEQFRPVDPDELRRRAPIAPPPKLAAPPGLVVPLRSIASRHRLLVAAAAALILLIGGIAFAHRGTRDPSRVDTTGDHTVITGPSTTSTSTSIPPCPAGAVNGCVDVPGSGTSLPGTTDVRPGDGGSVPRAADVPTSVDPSSSTVVVLTPPSSSPSISFPFPNTTTTRPSTGTTATTVAPPSSSTTTTTTPVPVARLSGQMICSPSPCSYPFGGVINIFRFPTVSDPGGNVPIRVTDELALNGDLPFGLYGTPSVHDPCHWENVSSPAAGLRITATDPVVWNYVCVFTPPTT